MNLPVFVHMERKALVKSATNRAVVELPPFYKWDHVNLQVTLLTDNPQATAAAPFLIIPTDAIDAIRAAIGNSLTGTARKVLAQQVTFLATPSAFVGTLSLATQEAQDYLAFPAAWRADAAYAKGALVYHKNYTWETLKEQAGPAPNGAEPGTDPTAWTLYEIEREPLFFEIEVVQRGNVWKVLHEPCVVAQPVMEEPLVSPDLLEDVDALADALARRQQRLAALPSTAAGSKGGTGRRYQPATCESGHGSCRDCPRSDALAPQQEGGATGSKEPCSDTRRRQADCHRCGLCGGSYEHRDASATELSRHQPRRDYRRPGGPRCRPTSPPTSLRRTNMSHGSGSKTPISVPPSESTIAPAMLCA
jgi:hypothetical protein